MFNSGVLYEHGERQSKLPIAEQYIHTVLKKGDINMIVTMLPALAEYLHVVSFVCVDYTYKRVFGNGMNEWEVATFLERLKCRKK
jgi:hypothetical protein